MPIATMNPTSGKTEILIEPHSAAEVDERIAQAAAAVEALKATTFAQRAEWMRAAAAILDDQAAGLGELITIEMGKPIAQSVAEVEKSAKAMRFYAEHSEEFLADVALEDPSTVNASAAWTRYEPLGVVLAVMPWNYPLWQVIRFAAPALMAGNAGLLKHASNVPQAALFLDTLFERAGFPEGSFRTLLIGGREVGAVIADPRVKAVTLTGSEPAGRSVAQIAGDHVKKAVLELGGSDPFIVLPSADVKAAAATAVRARINNNGQSCIAGKRFIVHADVYDEFAAEFATQMSGLVIGNPLLPETQVGPLATESGRQDLIDLVEDAREKGASILTGGTVPDLPGWFYAPTVIADLPEDARLIQEEAFGPVASLYLAKDHEDALRIANQTTFGLSSAVWTSDPEEEAFFVAGLDAGAVFVNGMTVSYQELPFGGVKRSGFGRELAAVGQREFCNLKTVWKA
ncbi:aldehyde dehydrogenase family protein [Pseudoclavibacter chungangensis]|uniref:Aldehyde dehydrogenase family protein n=1 Tax=Pseudoclavibacter chungangensis TaxID=587635 RepID=A0A7J5BMN1_9MICO|nr:aldehyde dehydrogenase family protein [Pseudoclavibacter chungangensis]KAB1652840.1 aldehyde dehydrogenase family protein [Pseudoclavibacter chungangensis]NYJ67164.1 succinate-semialdehyde dehydrogenase/glutarate-semialdehyde dehydrogenase [Pseudoclavibacter chungangensis]